MIVEERKIGFLKRANVLCPVASLKFLRKSKAQLVSLEDKIGSETGRKTKFGRIRVRK